MNGQATENPFNKAEYNLGLALSGGGVRASLFHIGVLARLAELDLLKSASVLSTVSGGSIIGAAYYLKANERTDFNRAQKRTFKSLANLSTIFLQQSRKIFAC